MRQVVLILVVFSVIVSILLLYYIMPFLHQNIAVNDLRRHGASVVSKKIMFGLFETAMELLFPADTSDKDLISLRECPEIKRVVFVRHKHN